MSQATPPMDELLRHAVAEAREVFASLKALAEPLARAADVVADTLLRGGKVLCCGNGGSAADCAHLTAELAGRFVLERRGYAAIDLTANHALVTALSNDYPPEQVFARQVAALGAPGDVLIALSSSGNSENVRLALAAATEHRLTSVAFLGKGGGACRGLANIELVVPSDRTIRVQEAHLLLYHSLCAAIDPRLAGGG